MKDNELDGLIIEFRFKLLIVGHLAHGLHEIFLDDVVSLCADGEEARLSAHVAQIGAVEAVRQFDDGFVVDVTMLCNWAGMDLQDLQAGLFVGQRNFDLPVQTARTQQSWVQCIGAIGCHYHFHLQFNKVGRFNRH